MIIDEPDVSPVIKPPPLTDIIDGLEDNHGVDAAAGGVPVSVVDTPTHKFEEPVMVGLAFTVIV